MMVADTAIGDYSQAIAVYNRRRASHIFMLKWEPIDQPREGQTTMPSIMINAKPYTATSLFSLFSPIDSSISVQLPVIRDSDVAAVVATARKFVNKKTAWLKW